MPVRFEISRACHSSAGTRPRSSSMEGRSSSAMLRTTWTLLSASLRMDSRWRRRSASPGADRAKIAQLHQQRGERLADFVVQLAGDGAALLLLRLHQARRELLELALRMDDLPVAQIGVPRQPQDVPGGGRRPAARQRPA